MHRRRARTALVAPFLLVAALGLSACGSDDDSTATDSPSPTQSASESPSERPSESPSETASESPTEAPEPAADVELTVRGGVWTPNGIRVEASVGEPVTIEITADAPGELHVHSTPEQEISYGKGTTTHDVTIETPGVVEVESHDPTAVVVQLEVR